MGKTILCFAVAATLLTIALVCVARTPPPPAAAAVANRAPSAAGRAAAVTAVDAVASARP